MNYSNIEDRMEKVVGAYERNLSEIRAGRANPAVLNKVKIDYYGVPTPISQVAGVSVPEARLIVIQPWDASVLKDIEKAILTSDIGINPNNDGKVIRLAFPELTEFIIASNSISAISTFMPSLSPIAVIISMSIPVTFSFS